MIIPNDGNKEINQKPKHKIIRKQLMANTIH